jgi:hypothetical protein
VTTKLVKCYNHKTKDSRFTKMQDSLIDEAVSVFVAPLVLPSVVVVPEPYGMITAPVKVDVRKISLVRGFLRRGFLGLSSIVPVKPQPSPDMSVASSSALVVKEDGEEGAFPFPLGGCSPVIPAADKGDDFRLTGLIQSQKWPVGFGPSSELVVWDQGDDFWDGEDGDFPFPLGVFPPAMPLDWALGCDKDVCPVVGVSCEGFEDTTMAILSSIEEDHPQEVKVCVLRLRGRRELLNLECSINYDIACASSRRGKGKAHVL